MPRRSVWIRLQLAVLALPFVLMAGVIAYGTTLPSRLDFSRSVEISRPPVEVFAALAEIEAMPAWSSRLVAVERLEDQGAHPVWRQTFAAKRTARLMVRERVPPSRLVFAIVDEAGPYRGDWILLVDPIPGGCRVTLTEQARLGNAVSRFLAHFASGKTRFAEDHLRDLARHLGSEAEVRDTEETRP